MGQNVNHIQAFIQQILTEGPTYAWLWRYSAAKTKPGLRKFIFHVRRRMIHRKIMLHSSKYHQENKTVQHDRELWVETESPLKSLWTRKAPLRSWHLRCYQNNEKKLLRGRCGKQVFHA